MVLKWVMITNLRLEDCRGDASLFGTGRVDSVSDVLNFVMKVINSLHLNRPQ